MSARSSAILALLLTGVLVRAATAPVTTTFSLPRRGTSREVSLEQLRGSIVVLDFFAHWCVPCLRSSSEIETGLRQHYEKQKGNLQGIPVCVFGVNIESARPDKTDAFIKRTGMKEVLEDLKGEFFQRLAGAGTPLIVIIDATGPGQGKIVYQKAGFEGAEKLRGVIDAIQPGAAPATLPTLTTTRGQTLDPAANDRATLDFAAMWASDILLTDESFEYRRTGPQAELGLSFSHGHIGLDYVPESLLEQPNRLDQDRYGLQAQGRLLVAERWTLNGGAGGYTGYMDYRSLWLDEHFRQLFGRRQGYEKAHPWGANLSGGARWEYLPASGFIQGDVIYQHDLISPGYGVLLTFPPTLVRFRDAYDTISGKMTFENVLTPRLRAQQELQVTDTTDRHLRFSGQSSLNWAVAEHWVTRLALAGTTEAPQFESWSVNATLERDWDETFFVSLFGRYYEDTGQIENALLADNTAAPPLHALYAGIGFRWQGEHSSIKLVAGPYFSRYEEPGPGASTFGHLYEDRDWFSVQFAFLHQF